MANSTRRAHPIRAVAVAAIVILGAGAAALAGGAPATQPTAHSTAPIASTELTGTNTMATTLPTPTPKPTHNAVVVEAANGAQDLPGWLHTDGATIRTADNEAYIIRAVSWFGMETSNCAPHGLWTITLESGLAQIKSMGFNTIRLPYSNECLASATTNSINYALNPALEGKSALEVMDAVVSSATSAGLNIILDRHRPDSAAQAELWYTSQYSEEQWIRDWQSLATRYAQHPAVIGFDLHNEPHGAACWGCGTPATDWQAAATRAGNAILAINPQLLIVVEGVENQSGGSSTWWGGGLGGVAEAPVTLDVAGRVVYSPHDYPASVYQQSWFSAPGYPSNLATVWDANWGYIAKEGIAPVLLGEFGTTLQTPSDQQWLSTLVNYLDESGISFAYWSFNPNSGDTGGLVQDDWVTPQAAKLAVLAPLLNPTSAPAPGVTPPAPSTPAPSSPGAIAPSPSSTPAAPGIPQPTIPQPTTPTTSTGPARVQATWALQNSWGEGYVVDIDVSSVTGAASWTVSWDDPAATRVVNSWGATCAVAPAGSITCSGTGWAASLAPGQTHRIGLQVEAPSAPASPSLRVTAK